MLPDTGTEVITAIDTTGIMPIPPIPGVPVVMLTPVLPEADVPAKAITVQTTQGTTNTIRQPAIAIHRAPTDTT